MDPDDADKIFEHSERRHKNCEEIFPYYNLKHERTLYDGTAMYYLALQTYDDMGAYTLPTMKKAILTLRLAWLTAEINQHCSGHNFDLISKMFYSKALFFYQQAVIAERTANETEIIFTTFLNFFTNIKTFSRFFPVKCFQKLSQLGNRNSYPNLISVSLIINLPIFSRMSII